MNHYYTTPHPPNIPSLRAPIKVNPPQTFHRPAVYATNPKSIYATAQQRSSVTQRPTSVVPPRTPDPHLHQRSVSPYDQPPSPSYQANTNFNHNNTRSSQAPALHAQHQHQDHYHQHQQQQQQPRQSFHSHRHSMYELSTQYQNSASQVQSQVARNPFVQPPAAGHAYAAAMSKVQQRIQQANAIAAANAATAPSQFQYPQTPQVQFRQSFSSTPHPRPQTVASSHSFGSSHSYSQQSSSPQRPAPTPGPTPGPYHAVEQIIHSAQQQQQQQQQAPPSQPIRRGRPESMPPPVRYYQQPLRPPADYPQTPAPPPNPPYNPPQTPFSHRHTASTPVSPARAPSTRRPLPIPGPSPGQQTHHRTTSVPPQRRELPPIQPSAPDPRPMPPNRSANVSQLISRFNGGFSQPAPIQTSQSQSAGYSYPSRHHASASTSTPSLPLRSPTYPDNDHATSPTAQDQNHEIIHPATPGRQSMNFDDSDDNYSDSEVSVPDSWRRTRTPSPQYGIRDLPSRNTHVSVVQSPQYGIRDLPTRSTRVQTQAQTQVPTQTQTKPEPHFDLRSIQNRPSKINVAPAPSTPSKRALPMPSPTRSQTMPTTPSVSSSSSTTSSQFTPRVGQSTSSSSTEITPTSRSVQQEVRQPRQPQPQPQTPQTPTKPSPFERRSPTVVQPQPTRQERQPSWSLPAVLQGHRSLSAVEERMSSMNLVNSNGDNGSVAEPPPPLVKETVNHQDIHARPLSRAAPSIHNTPRRRRQSVVDLSLDDAPPAPLPLRRSPSPSPTPSSSSSAPSIPLVKTPDQDRNTFVVPQISLPGGAGFDDDPGNGTGVPVISISTSASTPKNNPPPPSIPTINIPGGFDDDTDTTSGGPIISVSVPQINIGASPSTSTSTSSPALPIILNDLASSPSKRRLPQPPGPPSSVTASASNIRSRGGGLVCGGCCAPIVGRIVSAMNLRWHPHCFKCSTCGELLEHVSSYERDGKPYCHLDYHENFAPRCYHCKTPIIDERFITLDDSALGKRTYHEQHFFCAECGDPFLAPSIPKPPSQRGNNEISIKGDGAFDIAVDEDGDEVGFTVYRGHPYCEACHVRLRNPKCKACKKTITDGMRAVEALGGKWCWACFTCAGCNTPFDEPSFFQRDKKPFCEPCFSLILRNEV